MTWSFVVASFHLLGVWSQTLELRRIFATSTHSPDENTGNREGFGADETTFSSSLAPENHFFVFYVDRTGRYSELCRKEALADIASNPVFPGWLCLNDFRGERATYLTATFTRQPQATRAMWMSIESHIGTVFFILMIFCFPLNDRLHSLEQRLPR